MLDTSSWCSARQQQQTERHAVFTRFSISTAVAHRPWSILLVDQRCHGASAKLDGFAPPHTLAASASDIAEVRCPLIASVVCSSLQVVWIDTASHSAAHSGEKIYKTQSE